MDWKRMNWKRQFTSLGLGLWSAAALLAVGLLTSTASAESPHDDKNSSPAVKAGIAAPTTTVSHSRTDFPILQHDASSRQTLGMEPRTTGGFGWLDSSRFSLSHSVEYGMASGSRGSVSGGLWTTRLGYQIADPLRMNVDVGAVINTSGGEVLNQDSFFLKSMNLDYRPNKNFRMHIAYQGAPPVSGPWNYGAFRSSPWARRPPAHDSFEEQRKP